MNDEPLESRSGTCSQLDDTIRENPTGALLAAVGIGLAIGLLVRALQPRPAETRALRLLADLQDRIQDITGPAYQRASEFAGQGASAVKEGVDHLQDLHLDRNFRRLGRRLKGFFR